MGKNKPLTGRKRTLQLSGTRKVEAGERSHPLRVVHASGSRDFTSDPYSGSPLSGKGIYAQTTPEGSGIYTQHTRTVHTLAVHTHTQIYTHTQ